MWGGVGDTPPVWDMSGYSLWLGEKVAPGSWGEHAAFVSGRQLAASHLLCANSRSRLDLFWGISSNFAEKPHFLIFF